MSHPFMSLNGARRKQFFWISLIFTLLIMAIMNVDGSLLVTEAAPSGIVSYEMAGSAEKADQILSSWDAHAKLYAAFSLGLDYAFMLAYATTLSLACLWAGEVLRTRGWPLAVFGVPLAWGQWLAAGFDAVENLALSVLLLQSVSSPWPEIARWCATLKFTLIFLGLAYALLGLVAFLVQRFVPRREALR